MTRRIVEVGASDVGPNRAASVGDDQNRHVARLTHLACPIAGHGLQAALQHRVEGGAHDRAVGRAGTQAIGEMGCQEGGPAARAAHRLATGQGDLRLGVARPLSHPCQHQVPNRSRRRRRAVGAEPAGRPRQGHQQGRLAGRQRLRLAPEVGARGRAHAFQIAAEGGERQIHVEDLVLGVPPLELEGAEHLDQLGSQAARTRSQQARRLHGKGGGAGDDPARHHGLSRRPRQSQRIDARVIPEALVLEGDQHPDVARIDLAGPGRQASHPVRAQIGPQQPALPVDDLGREAFEAGEVGRINRIEQPKATERQEADRRHRQARGREPASGTFESDSQRVISSHPVGPRA